MSEHLKSPALRLRTAFFVAYLRRLTGLSRAEIERRVRENQYEAAGLMCPSPDTVRDYLRLRRCPAFDPDARGAPPWLMAVECEWPGTAYSFFHPLFDLVFGPMESSVLWRMKVQEIPEAWIRGAENAGRVSEADEWRKHNQALKPKRGRPGRRAGWDPLEFVHRTLMRLREPAFSILFSRSEEDVLLHRRYGSIESELVASDDAVGLDSLAMKVGLMMEAAVIGDMARRDKAMIAVRESLAGRVFGKPELVVIPALQELLEGNWALQIPIREYALVEAGSGFFPMSWSRCAIR